MMMFNGGKPHFAVVYADGDMEVNIGTIAVNPAALTFKRLLSLLSHKVGISPHNFSVFLAAVGYDRKIPLNAKVNLAAVMPLNGTVVYYFLIVKRSSSKRSKKAASATAAAHPPSPASERKAPPENVMLLRRHAGESQLASFRAAAAPSVMDRVEFGMRMMNLRTQRERFLMNMAINEGNNIGGEASNGAVSVVDGIYSSGGRERRGLGCEECLRETTMGTNDGGFHPCVNDEIIVGFQSPAGPISRPPERIPARIATYGRIWRFL